MRKNINEAEWKVRVDLAAMFRLTHMMGWDDSVWNHITITHISLYLIQKHVKGDAPLTEY